MIYNQIVTWTAFAILAMFLVIIMQLLSNDESLFLSELGVSQVHDGRESLAGIEL